MGGHLLQGVGYSSMLLLPLYLDHLGATRLTIGLIMSVSAVGALLVRPAVGFALDVVGRKPTLIVGTVILSSGMLMVAGVTDIGPLVYGMRLMVGLGTATLFTAYFTFAADVVPVRRRTEGLALFGISGLVPLLVNPISGWLGVDAPGLRWFLPALGLLVLSSMLFVLPLREVSQVRAPSSVGVGSGLRALRHRSLWPVWLATVVFSGMVAVFMAFVTVTAASRGMDNPASVWLTYALGAVCVRLFGATLPERVGPSLLFVPAIGSYIAGVALAAVATGSVGFAVAGLLAGIGHGYCFPILSGQVVTRTPDALRGTAMSMFTAMWDLAKLLVVPVMGLVAHRYGDATMLTAVAAVAVVGAAGWAALERGAEPLPTA